MPKIYVDRRWRKWYAGHVQFGKLAKRAELRFICISNNERKVPSECQDKLFRFYHANERSDSKNASALVFLEAFLKFWLNKVHCYWKQYALWHGKEHCILVWWAFYALQLVIFFREISPKTALADQFAEKLIVLFMIMWRIYFSKLQLSIFPRTTEASVSKNGVRRK